VGRVGADGMVESVTSPLAEYSVKSTLQDTVEWNTSGLNHLFLNQTDSILEF